MGFQKVVILHDNTAYASRGLADEAQGLLSNPDVQNAYLGGTPAR